ncbi:MAG: hypothetical protein BWK78_02290 [Thiotrichaceae bacterium IS1]|nr:MAG: hypothetical protein BWK78_02290 [Thiotrichaceae bacterium IS1]
MRQVHLSNTRIVFIALWMLFFTTPVWGSTCVVEIVKIHGDTKWFQITKPDEGKLDNPGMGTFLEPGYKIQVLQAEDRFKGILDREEYSITLFLAKDEYKTLKYADTKDGPYTVKCSNDSPPPSLLGNWLVFVQKTLEKLRLQNLGWLQTITGGSEADTLSMPLFTTNSDANSDAKLVGGRTKVYLGWKGGKLPYTVRVFDDHNKIVEEQSNLKKTDVELAGGKFTERQHYTVVVSETNTPDHKATGTFTVVNKSALPTEVAIENSNLLPQTKRTFQATWLINQDRKVWSFEAYQQAIEILRDYPAPKHYPAELLKQGLKEGWNK